MTDAARRLLALLPGAGEPITVRKLAHLAGLSDFRVGAACRELVEAGFAVRLDSGDRHLLPDTLIAKTALAVPPSQEE